MAKSNAAGISHMPDFAPRFYGIAALVCAIVVTGLALVSRFSALDLARDLQEWQEKLNLIAESRTAETEGWVSSNFKELRTLADNPSLQLYMTELEARPAGGSPGNAAAEPAQQSYLRNLVLFTAQRTGFGAGNASAIPANVQPQNKSGLAILGKDNQILVSTLMLPGVREAMLEQAKTAAPGHDALIDLRKDKEGAPYIGFIVPVYSVQGDRSAAAQLGWVTGIKTIDSNLFALLKPPGATEKTLEVLLVRHDGDKIDYLSPLQDGSAALSRQAPSDTATAEGQLLAASGNFLSDQKDYRSQQVLATSRPVAGTPWTLIVKIDRQEALAASNERRAGLEIFFFLIIAIIVLMVVALWWHARSKRSLLMSGHFRALAARSAAQEQLLRLVTDNQPEPIIIVGRDAILHFANRPAAERAHMRVESISGKSLGDVLGDARARAIAHQCEAVLKTGETQYDVQRVTQDGNEKIIRSAYVPLKHIPVAALPSDTPGILVVEQDISAVVHEREQRMLVQRQMIDMLIRLVDRRDPFAANHSLLVSHMAWEVAVEMELDNAVAETARIAGSLMNIGKIVVPAELLTKAGSLNGEEKRIIRESMNAAADLLTGISFEGPVAETLRQWQEKWDGTGQLGLKGEDILPSARIIAAANAFVGMISPRSWRTAISIEAATKFLLDQCGTHFDQRVVIALIHYVENHRGKAWLSSILDGQRDAA